jgi:uncharacterized membrane protein YagU involved in acid resistance
MAAQAVADVVIDRPLTCAELSIAARVLHFGFGAAVGAVHGVFAEQTAVRRQSGLRLDATLWLAADEIAMPMLGVSESTVRRPLEMHLQSFTAHLVYVVIAERGRWLTRSLMPGAAAARRTTDTPSTH